jgi:putative nucleotidyltransferase with HDIG domain
VLPIVALFASFAREREARIDGALERSQAYRGTALLLGDVIEANDQYTGDHTKDVVELTVQVADALGVDADICRGAEFGALLHDVGKIHIPSAIINKPGPLDDDEWAIMKTHTVEGQRMLERVGGLLARVGVVCGRRTSGGTAAAIRTGWRERTSRWRPGSSPSATPTTR